MNELTILVCIVGICLVLPLAIVWIISRRKMHEADKTCEIALEILRMHPETDMEELIRRITVKRPLSERLIPLLWVGLVFTLSAVLMTVLIATVDLASAQGKYFICFCAAVSYIVGISSLVCWFTGKRERN